jgi:tetratricopeptide (TPR) repeat protein
MDGSLPESLVDPWQSFEEDGRELAASGQFASAVRLYRQAIRLAEEASAADECLSRLFGTLGEVQLEKGDLDDALDALKAALAHAQAAHDHALLAMQHRRLGTAYREAGEVKRAADEFDQAESFLRRVDPRGDSHSEWGFLKLQQGILQEEGGHHPEALLMYRAALGVHERQADATNTVASLRHVASALQELSSLEAAEDELRRALDLLQSQCPDDVPELIELNNLLGSVIEDRGHPAKALELYERALELADSINHSLGRARALRHIGSAYASKGEFRRAAESYEQAIRIFNALDDEVELSGLWGDLGEVHLEQGHYDLAIEAFRCALAFDQSHPDLLGMAAQHRRLGAAYEELGDYSRAADELTSADQLLRQTSDLGEKAILLNQRGSLHRACGEYDEALDCCSEALDISRTHRNEVGTIISLRQLASVHIDLNQFGEAESLLLQARKLLEAHGGEDKPELIEVDNLLARAYIAQGEAEKAIFELTKAADIARALSLDRGAAHTAQLLGSAHASRKHYARARDCYGRAEKHFRETHDDVALAQVLGEQGALSISVGELKEACAYYNAGLRISRRRNLPTTTARLGLGAARCYRLLRNSERVADALDEVQESIDVARSPLRGDLWLEMAQLAELENHLDVDDAVGLYQQALEVFTARNAIAKQQECHRLLASVWLRQGDMANATGALFSALRLAPADSVPFLWTGMVAQLDERLSDPATPAFAAGDYESALQMAFRSCEAELRNRVGAPAKETLSELVPRWFTPEQRGLAPWADAKELAAFGRFWNGAFGARRNPQAHRALPIDAREAFSWLAVTHLMVSLLDAEPVAESAPPVASQASIVQLRLPQAS